MKHNEKYLKKETQNYSWNLMCIFQQSEFSASIVVTEYLEVGLENIQIKHSCFKECAYNFCINQD